MSQDALRNTLDHLALDPDSGADRHYLVTMLRRLGYTEQEIREAIGDAEEGRVIEVEYNGQGTSFLFARQGAKTFQVTNEQAAPVTFRIAHDEDAGSETFEEVNLDDVDVSDDWGDWNDETPEDFEDAEGDLEEDGLVTFLEKNLVAFREKEELVPFTMEGAGSGWTEVSGPGYVEESEEEPELEWAVDEAPGDAWAPVEEPEDLAWQDADASFDETAEAPFVYEDYVLYTRPVELTTGKMQHIYFFSKDTPNSGEACALPDGYEVGVSEKTGLPFLRKSDHDAAKLQCGALTEGLKQCRLTAQDGSDFCHVHVDYIPPTEAEMKAMLDTAPAQDVFDSMPSEGGEGSHQCAGITAAGLQCRNTSRTGSKYCASHKGYRPHSATLDTDTAPVGKHVVDTMPATVDGGHPKASDGAVTFRAPESSGSFTANPSAGKRVRVRRVAANSPEEARAIVAQEGGEVREVVPVRIEERHD